MIGRSKPIHELAAEAGFSRSYFTRVFRLSVQAPKITKAIIQGRQPSEFSAIKLTRPGRFPLRWPEIREFGLRWPRRAHLVPSSTVELRPRVSFPAMPPTECPALRRQQRYHQVPAWGLWAQGRARTGTGAVFRSRVGWRQTAKPPTLRANSGLSPSGRQCERYQRVIWRREWDSNPRDPCEPTRVPGVRLQPLGHLSGPRWERAL